MDWNFVVVTDHEIQNSTIFSKNLDTWGERVLNFGFSTLARYKFIIIFYDSLSLYTIQRMYSSSRKPSTCIVEKYAFSRRFSARKIRNWCILFINSLTVFFRRWLNDPDIMRQNEPDFRNQRENLPQKRAFITHIQIIAPPSPEKNFSPPTL